MIQPRVKNLTKDFKEVKAVDNLNLTVNRGDVFGFLFFTRVVVEFGVTVLVINQPVGWCAHRCGAAFVGNRRMTLCGWIVQNRLERNALSEGRLRQTGQFAKRREDVERFNRGARRFARRLEAGIGNDQRRTIR